MTSLRYDEQSLTGLPVVAMMSSQRQSIRRYDSAIRRLARLERLADDPETCESLVDQGRYLRLCAAIAWASDHVAQARHDVYGQSDRHLQ